MQDGNQIRVSVVVHSLLAAGVAYASTMVVTGLAGLGLGLIVLFAADFLLERALGKKGVKWWLANGAAIYVLFWLVGVIYLFNI
ncbi:MAG: hypothetical protein HY369_02375 [Candidatus Aenigmarchaeota archaeon]|nr:hypothetical protein [Candidatus Aenigmarchaeota archaeon]